MPNQLPSGDDVNHIPTVPPAGSNTITPGTCGNSFICTAGEKISKVNINTKQTDAQSKTQTNINQYGENDGTTQ